jgi:hypothetical protein
MARVGSRCVTNLLYRREVKIPQLLGEGEHGKGGSRCVTDMMYRREVKIPQLLGVGEHGKGGQQMCH